MTDIQPENQGFYRATVFLRAVWQRGVKHAVISPGSRSTPLTMAAAAFPGLKKQVVLDERSAAFMALGIGKSTNMPAALICTSGTAVANYFPAVVEAKMSGIPLLLLTADRPPKLHHTEANQTIDQQNIFGGYPVFFHDTGEWFRPEENLPELDVLGNQAVHYARDNQGPVHINFPFRKPLEPKQNFVDTITKENDELSQTASIKFPKGQTQRFRFDDDILNEIHATGEPLIVVGQLTPASSLDPIFGLAESLNAPVLSEQGIINPDYAIQGFEGFLRQDDNRRKLAPDLIFRFGHEPASKSLLQAIKKWSPRRHIYFSDSGSLSNVGNTTTDFMNWKENYFDAEKFPEKSPHWLGKWKQAEREYFEASTTILENTEQLTDGHIYHHLVPKIPEEWSVSISNSLPVRDQSMFGHWASQKKFTNRGASGIDGITSTAMGVSLGLHQPGLLFTGDLAFLHDTNALLNHSKLRQPLVVVVINNGGGSIFRMLPIADHKKHFETYFETPQQANITALCRSYGIDTTCIETVRQLKELELEALVKSSNSLLHVVECKTDTEAAMEVRNIIWSHKL